MSARVYTPEIKEFIEENYKGRTSAELARMVNERFGLHKTSDQIRSYKRKQGLRSGRKSGGESPIPEEIRTFMHENCTGNGYQAMADLIQEKFGVEYTANKIRSYYRNHKLRSGNDTRFRKGERQENGCTKGVCYPGSEKGWFRKGEKPATWVPVGTERIRSSGYIWVKIAEPRKWRMKQLVVWEAAYGPVPKGYHLFFRDGNKENCELSNLMLIDDRVRGPLNRSGLANVGEACIDAAIKVCEMKMAINEAKRRKEDGKTRDRGSFGL